MTPTRSLKSLLAATCALRPRPPVQHGTRLCVLRIRAGATKNIGAIGGRGQDREDRAGRPGDVRPRGRLNSWPLSETFCSRDNCKLVPLPVAARTTLSFDCP